MKTITMSTTEQRRAWVLNRLGKGELTTGEAAGLLGLSERQVWRLRVAFEAHGPAGLVHGNRGRASPRRIELAVAERVVELAQGRSVPHLGRGANGTNGVVIVQDRQAENGHYRVADELLDRPTVALDHGLHLEIAGHHDMDGLGIEQLAEGRRTHHVAEQDGHRPARPGRL